MKTKADPLYDRLEHAFGRDRLMQEIKSLNARRDCDPLWHLTDEAIDVLKYRLMSNLKLQRKFAAANRAVHAAKQGKSV